MNRAKLNRFARKAHRYLGLIFGLQFMCWTLGGLYFSWTNIKHIRGDDIRKDEPAIQADSSVVTLAYVMTQVRLSENVSGVNQVKLVDVLGKSYYQLEVISSGKKKILLADTRNGLLRKPLNKEEAIAVAISRLNVQAPVEKATYITEVGDHHEYREKPLPVWAVDFSGDINTTVYVGAETGVVQSLRNNSWRAFDFLWMLHTMDYQGRDSINNWVLRIFSILGVITLLSGFLLFFISLKRKRKTG